VSEFFNDAYYAAATAPPRLEETQSEVRLRQVLNATAFDIVDDTVSRWNGALRSEIRTITALKLTNDGRTIANVPVSVVDGMPKPLAELTKEIEAWQWWLVLHRSVLEQADRGLNLVVEQKELLSKHVPDVSTRMGAVWLSRTLITDVLKRSIDDDLLMRFQKIGEDILGAYWVHASKIQLYWMPLAIF
jgi:hypothetical protein